MWSCPQHLAVFLPPHMQHHPTSFIGPSPLPARSKLTHLKLSLCLAADILFKCLATSQWYKLIIQHCLENQNWGTLANVFRQAYNFMLSGQGLPKLYKAGSLLSSLAKLSNSAQHMGALVHSIVAIAGWPPRLVPCAGKVLANSACEGFNTKYKTIQSGRVCL